MVLSAGSIFTSLCIYLYSDTCSVPYSHMDLVATVLEIFSNKFDSSGSACAEDRKRLQLESSSEVPSSLFDKQMKRRRRIKFQEYRHCRKSSSNLPSPKTWNARFTAKFDSGIVCSHWHQDFLRLTHLQISVKMEVLRSLAKSGNKTQNHLEQEQVVELL